MNITYQSPKAVKYEMTIRDVRMFSLTLVSPVTVPHTRGYKVDGIIGIS